MVDYKPYKFRDISGIYNATVTDITAVENEWYDPERDNSTPFTLNISFDLKDEEYGLIQHVQRFVAPLTGNNTLFQQLLDVCGELPDMDGGNFDEQRFVGMKVKLQIGKRVAKDGREYPTVDWVVAPDPLDAHASIEKKKTQKAKEAKAENSTANFIDSLE